MERVNEGEKESEREMLIKDSNLERRKLSLSLSLSPFWCFPLSLIFVGTFMIHSIYHTLTENYSEREWKLKKGS